MLKHPTKDAEQEHPEMPSKGRKSTRLPPPGPLTLPPTLPVRSLPKKTRVSLAGVGSPRKHTASAQESAAGRATFSGTKPRSPGSPPRLPGAPTNPLTSGDTAWKRGSCTPRIPIPATLRFPAPGLAMQPSPTFPVPRVLSRSSAKEASSHHCLHRTPASSLQNTADAEHGRAEKGNRLGGWGGQALLFLAYGAV